MGDRRAPVRHVVLGLLCTAALFLGLAAVTPSAALAAAPVAVSGTVTAVGGDAVAGARVIAYQYDDVNNEWMRVGRTHTADDGTYTLTVLEGIYRVGFGGGKLVQYRPSFWDGAASVEDAADITVGPDGTTGIDGELSPRTTIAGQMTFPDGWQGDRDSTVQLIKADTGRIVRNKSFRGDHYSFRGMRPGSYQVSFNRLSGEYSAVGQFFNGVIEPDNRSHATTIDLGEGEFRTGIDATQVHGGTLSGKVVDAEGATVPGCRVAAFTPDDRLIGRTARQRDASGFTIEGLTTGDYLFKVDRCNAEGFRRHGPWYYDGDEQLGTGAAGARISAVLGEDVTLPEPLVITPRGHTRGAIGGTVGLPDGATETDRVVRLVRVDGVRHRSRVIDVGSDGTYEFRKLLPGSYRLSFGRLSGFAVGEAQFYDNHPEAEGRTSGDLLTVVAGERTVADAVVREGGHLVGHIVDSAGTPLTNCSVQAFTEHDRLVGRYATTGDDGAFDVGGLTTGSYLLQVRHGDCGRRTFYYDGSDRLNRQWDARAAVDASAGSTDDIGDLVIPARARISGTVTLPAGAETNRANRSVQLIRARTGQVVRYGQAHADGTYQFRRLRPGSYRVAFARLSGASVAAQYYDGVAEGEGLRAGDKITVAGGDNRTGIDAALSDGGRIVGRVIDSDGDPIADCTVAAFTARGRLHGSGATTESDGSFLIEGLSTGSYHLMVGGPMSNGCAVLGQHSRWGGGLFLAADGALVNDAGSAIDVPVTVGEATSLSPDVIYARRGTLTGALEFPGRDSWAPVSVVDAETGAVLVRRNFYSDTSFTFGGLADGTYRIEVVREDTSTSLAASFFTNVPEEAGVDEADEFTLTGGNTIDVGTQTLQRGGGFHGTVVDAEGAPLSRCSVWAFNDELGLSQRYGRTGRNGQFVTGGLTTAEYRVAVDCGGGTEYYAGTHGILSDDAGDAQSVNATLGARVDFANPLVYGGEAAPFVASTAAPTITGTPQVGEVLVATPGGWEPDPESIAYQWLADGQPIAGANANSIALTTGEVGKRISVLVTATVAGYQPGAATSGETTPVVEAPIPEESNQLPPTIAGEAKVGSTLHALPGLWTPEPSGLAYQWLADGAAINGATGESLALTPALVGKVIRVRVTASSPGVNDGVATSASVGPVAEGEFTSSAPPAITGAPRVGETLTSSNGTWNPQPDSLDYQWLRDGEPIAGATGSTYVLTSDDRGAVISARVTAKRSGYADKAVESAGTEAVKPAQISGSGVPEISGTARVGHTLTATPGSWSADDLTFSYQWQVDGEDVDGATNDTFELAPSTAGGVVTVAVTASGSDRDPVTVVSDPTGPVALGILRKVEAPEVKGEVTPGEKLKVQPGAVQIPADVSFRWFLDGKAIKGETDRKLKVTRAMKGAKLSVEITYSADGYKSRTVTLHLGPVR